MEYFAPCLVIYSSNDLFDMVVVADSTTIIIDPNGNSTTTVKSCPIKK